PAWAAGQGREDGDGSTYGGRSGRLPCEQAPSTVPPGGEVRFRLVLDDVALGQPGPRDAARTTVQWGIAGPEAAQGSVAYVR
ncbi:MAG: hypothetical protein JWO60_874, partial [Frankiales bacterium]|nr:hypothetical protein [Frankiales bacterium]